MDFRKNRSSRPDDERLLKFAIKRWQARRVSNPQPAVLETAALPIELLACATARFFTNQLLLNNLGDYAGPDRASAFTNGEAQTFVHSNRGNEVDGHADIVAGHHHFHAFR